MSSLQGRHRAPRPQSGTRRIATRASVAGATLALPLIGAGTALAEDGDTYTVKAGDSLSLIAMEQEFEGGWEQLYEDNKSVIGEDPNLIAPGDELSLDGPSEATSTSAGQTSYGTNTTSSEPTAVMPISGGTETAGFAESGGTWSSGEHSGQDWSVPVGTTVKAATGGTVVTAGWQDSFGYEIVIKHGDGDYTQYAHLSQIDVTVGDSVGMGDRIALSGATGNVTGAHLHFEARTTAEYGSSVDPIEWLKDHGVSV